MRVLLVSGSGGVLLDMLALRPWWSRHDASWVAAPAADTAAALAGLPVTWEPDPPGAASVIAATWRALALLRRDRPDLVISAGRRLALPYFVAARLRGVPAVWVETLTQVGPPTGSARLCVRLARSVLVQRGERSDAGVLVGELY
jgi:beta-1,4-N-acetylglucosaminyltransferase